MPSKSKNSADHSVFAWAAIRISLGFIFLWAFVDKLWGLGFSTCRDAKTGAITHLCQQAWVKGGSPTSGFLLHGTKGPFASFYQGLAGNHFIDALFMLGLLLIGAALLFGVGVRIACLTGGLLLFMMWSAGLWPATNPVLDEHIVYIFALIGIYFSNNRQVWGLRNWWVKQDLVKKYPILE